MFIEVPDILRCPHCGPDHPVILLVEESRDRRVLRGWLGCPNCGRDYAISGGVADLRRVPETRPGVAAPYRADELAVKIGALSEAGGGGGYLVLDARLGHVAGELADLLPDIEIVTLGGAVDGSEGAPGERVGVSRVISDGPAPLAPARVRAAAAVPQTRERTMALARAVVPGGRLVLFGVNEGDLEPLDRWGFELLAHEGDIAVARRRSDVAFGPAPA